MSNRIDTLFIDSDGNFILPEPLRVYQIRRDGLGVCLVAGYSSEEVLLRYFAAYEPKLDPADIHSNGHSVYRAPGGAVYEAVYSDYHSEHDPYGKKAEYAEQVVHRP